MQFFGYFSGIPTVNPIINIPGRFTFKIFNHRPIILYIDISYKEETSTPCGKSPQYPLRGTREFGRISRALECFVRLKGSAELAPRLVVAFYNKDRVDAEHAEGIVHDVVYGEKFFRFVGHKVVQGAFRVEVIEVDGGVNYEVIE